MKKIELKDWQKRALKTFVQAFFGVLIPAIVNMLMSAEIPSDLIVWVKTTAFSVVCSALAAGISAAWNIILESKNVTFEDVQDLIEEMEEEQCCQ